MQNPQVSSIRHVELAVPDLKAATEFYSVVWGLRPVASDAPGQLLRAAGGEHHILRLVEGPTAQLRGAGFAAPDAATIHALHARAGSLGVKIRSAPHQLPAGLGGGFGFVLETPDGLPLTISSDMQPAAENLDLSGVPHKLAHVVINSADVDSQFSFFCDTLGFKLSDSNGRLEFIRCNADHHSVALARATGMSLNHMAFELPDIENLMQASGRVKLRGHELDWGVGRHGPGNNVFSYFVDPMGFVAEFTTEVQQIDEASHVPQDAEYWSTAVIRPCRWGMAMSPSPRARKAMAGDYQNQLLTQASCDELIARKLS